MREPPILRGESVVLEPLRDDDVHPLFDWINDRDLVVLSAPFRPVAWDDHVRWFTSVRTGGDVMLGIRDPAGDRLLGTCQLLIDRTTPTAAELRIRIGDPAGRDGGRGTEAVRLLTAYGHDVLGLERIRLEVLATNERARRVYEKCGFRTERVRPAAVEIEGRSVDVVDMGHAA